MSYRINPKASVPDDLKRIAREELESGSRRLLQATDTSRDEAIHEARKSLKKTRAVLRLVRSELGADGRQQNQRLRDLGRTLSDYRDAGAMVGMFDQIREKYETDLGKRTLGTVRRALVVRKDKAEKASGIQAALNDIGEKMQAEASSTGAWILTEDGFAAIAPGLKNSFRQGRKALRRAEKDSAPETFHECRKRAKDHWYHVRLLEELWTSDLQEHEKSLKKLEQALGDDHNLTVMEGLLNDGSEPCGSPADRKMLLKLIGRYRKDLRKEALSLGADVYDEKPKQFVKRIGSLWPSGSPKPAPKPVRKQTVTKAIKTTNTAA